MTSRQIRSEVYGRTRGLALVPCLQSNGESSGDDQAHAFTRWGDLEAIISGWCDPAVQTARYIVTFRESELVRAVRAYGLSVKFKEIQNYEAHIA